VTLSTRLAAADVLRRVRSDRILKLLVHGVDVRLKSGIVISLTLILSSQAHALRDQDMSGDDAGAVAVYNFDETSGDTAYDSSGVGAPLNLKMMADGNLPTFDGTVIRTNALFSGNSNTPLYSPNALIINPKPNGAPDDPDKGYESAQRHRTFLLSETAATKLNSCTNFTIQAFVRPWFPKQGNDQSGNMIVGLTNSTLTTAKNPNFGLYQTGQSGSESAQLLVRTAGAPGVQPAVTGAYTSVRQLENPGKFTELIATREPSGVLSIYVNRMVRSSTAPVAPVFDPNARLIIGNEMVALTLNGKGETDVGNQRNWSGEIAHLAIYCRGYTRAEILGTLEENKIREAVVRPTSTQITQSRQEARKMVERLTGTVVPVDHPMVLRVEDKLLKNDRVGAAKIITGDMASGEPGHPGFLNTVVKQMAMKISNREETIRAPFNDMAASFVGITRDERSAKELLTGDFYYRADPTKAKVRSDMFRDFLISNNHYDDLERDRWDLGKVLMRVQGQQIAMDASGTYAPNPDPAGVITSRAFMSAHAVAGTNRRLVEYSFRSFMCVPMSEMADTSASPARIGRDIDRLPGGDAVKFETSCKGCHTVMDGFRGAFAHFDFSTLTSNGLSYSVVRHTQLNKQGSFRFENQDPDPKAKDIPNAVDVNETVRKMNHNETVFPNGYEITDDSFINNAVGVKNKDLFGWSGSRARGGVGVNQFGQMIADSTRFSQCMAKRVYEAVCLPGMKTEARVTPLIQGLAVKFQESGYKFRTLFQEAAANPGCLATGR
jgi:hypothetical protein